MMLPPPVMGRSLLHTGTEPGLAPRAAIATAHSLVANAGPRATGTGPCHHGRDPSNRVKVLRERTLLSSKGHCYQRKNIVIRLHDAALRAAGLSNFFTQDLDEALPPPPEPHDQAPGPDARSAQQSPTRASAAPHQVRAIRGLLRQSGRGEQDILQQLEIGALDQLSERRAAKLIARLHELNQQSRAANGAEKGIGP